MEKGNIKIVEIADFKNSEHVLDYVDNDFVIINSLEGSPYNEDTIRLGCFLIAICLEGCIQLDVNYKTYQLEAGDLLLGLPNTIISHAMVSPKHKIRLAAFSTQFLQRVVKMECRFLSACGHQTPATDRPGRRPGSQSGCICLHTTQCSVRRDLHPPQDTRGKHLFHH